MATSVRDDLPADGRLWPTPQRNTPLKRRDNSAATRAQFANHLSYVETDSSVVVEITPPLGMDLAGARASGPAATVWSSVRKIRWRNTSADIELILVDGRRITGDLSAFGSLGQTASARLRETQASLTPQQRARILRNKLRPFLRVRLASALSAPDFGREPAAEPAHAEAAIWSRANSDFDILARREVSGATETGSTRLLISTELRNARVSGLPRTF